MRYLTIFALVCCFTVAGYSQEEVTTTEAPEVTVTNENDKKKDGQEVANVDSLRNYNCGCHKKNRK